jgi:hypothetical protein
VRSALQEEIVVRRRRIDAVDLALIAIILFAILIGLLTWEIAY